MSRTSGRSVLAREREVQALELRKAGASYAAIGQALGISAMGAYKAVQRALKRLTKHSEAAAAEVRALELARLDAMLLAIWPQVKQGHLGAIDRALRISQRRAALLGLDAPMPVVGNLQIQLRWDDSDAERSYQPPYVA